MKKLTTCSLLGIVQNENESSTVIVLTIWIISIDNWNLLSKRVTAWFLQKVSLFKGSLPQVLFGKSVLKICSKFTGEHPCGSVISIKL